MKMLSLAVVIVSAGALAACTSAERTATGAGAGAIVGAAVSSNPLAGAAIGAVIGGFGTYIAEVADGQCQYRNSRGEIYTTRCHWL